MRGLPSVFLISLCVDRRILNLSIGVVTLGSQYYCHCHLAQDKRLAVDRTERD